MILVALPLKLWLQLVRPTNNIDGRDVIDAVGVVVPTPALLLELISSPLLVLLWSLSLAVRLLVMLVLLRVVKYSAYEA